MRAGSGGQSVAGAGPGRECVLIGEPYSMGAGHFSSTPGVRDTARDTGSAEGARLGRIPREGLGAPPHDGVDSPIVILDLAAVCLLRGRSCLNVRKAGTHHVILPGGKIEPGETALEAAVREAAEEVRLHLDPASLNHLGTFEAAPANNDAEGIRCAVFVRSWDDAWAHPAPDHEISEYEWTPLDTAADDPRQAPLLVDSVIPELLRRRLI